ncbi:hypothetical protein CEUSTIGMA_g5856.t1 [Chlamydomonas eustigma]|uniref:Lipocalin-like domain-containing protein n=1 Tax=Chlamydomonas eustigma TaxID=1157962 RepID=A0A250X5P6_9CHLO|nr:hypothetical protein CEUSTIGMA_g5856.t1 [Chlamydomonas eustigma]|eukprot:GAX78414.1 hypothetical protein CEUSTIGMA_g5856.t1 [Chlamydomonas eustigma]
MANALFGTWKLTAAQYAVIGSSEIIDYLGDEPQGCLVYTPQGDMTVQLMGSSRPVFTSGDRLGGTDEEVRAAFESYQAYFGSYEVDMQTGTVTHVIQGCFFPNFVGSRQLRYFKLEGIEEGSPNKDKLILTTPPLLMRGKEARGHLIWQRST